MPQVVAPPADYWPDDYAVEELGAIEEIRSRWRKEAEQERSETRLRILRRDGFRCQGARLLTRGKPCTYPVGFKRRSREFHVHHIIPRSKGGTDDDYNLITLCHICHRRMGEEHCRVKKLHSTAKKKQGRYRADGGAARSGPVS